LLAHHCEQAGLKGEAIGYRRKAAQLAIGRSALTEAEAQLRKGLGLLASLPECPERQHHELRLQIALGLALGGMHGEDVPLQVRPSTGPVYFAQARTKQTDSQP